MSSFLEDEKILLLAQSQLCSSAKRYEDAIKFLKLLLLTGIKPDDDEIKLISYVYKSVIKEKREQFRKIDKIHIESIDLTERKKEIIKELKNQIIQEIKIISLELIEIFDKYIIPRITSIDIMIYSLMIKADHYRYLAEITKDEEREEYANISSDMYGKASEMANIHLMPTDPIRLNLSLNHSVLCYDILNLQRRACAIAKEAFEGAITDMPMMFPDDFAKITNTLKSLTDNLSLWELGHQDQQFQNDNFDD